MKQVTLNLQDSMYEHFMYLISHLDSAEVQLVSETNQPVSQGAVLKQQFAALLNSTDQGLFKHISDPVAWQRAQRDEWS